MVKEGGRSSFSQQAVKTMVRASQRVFLALHDFFQLFFFT
jgi:hypothetical protein